MNIRKIEVFDYATEIIKALSKGAVITAKADNRVNAMTISWGTLGREWERKIFTIFIRETRYTHELLEKNPEFIVCIPQDGFNRKMVGVFGTKSGHNIDKVEAVGVRLLEGEMVSTPAFAALQTRRTGAIEPCEDGLRLRQTTAAI